MVQRRKPNCQTFPCQVKGAPYVRVSSLDWAKSEFRESFTFQWEALKPWHWLSISDTFSLCNNHLGWLYKPFQSYYTYQWWQAPVHFSMGYIHFSSFFSTNLAKNPEHKHLQPRLWWYPILSHLELPHLASLAPGSWIFPDSPEGREETGIHCIHTRKIYSPFS